MRECTNCKYGIGIGSDVWCGHEPKGNESYMCDTDCPYWETMDKATYDWTEKINGVNMNLSNYNNTKVMMERFGITDKLNETNYHKNGRGIVDFKTYQVIINIDTGDEKINQELAEFCLKELNTGKYHF